MRINPFSSALSGHAHPFICALDPFKLGERAMIDRLHFLEQHGAAAALIASTDDERYDSTMPALIARLQADSGLRLIEHFRPHPVLGFRRAGSRSYVMMTTVANSNQALYRNGATDGIEPAGLQGAGGKLIASRALVFGVDEKSEQYVGSRFMCDDTTAMLPFLVAGLAHQYDVYYLFCRRRKLAPAVIAAVRGLVGAHQPVVASGCIQTLQDISDALQAGANFVVVGSLLEGPGWRERLIGLMAEEKSVSFSSAPSL